MHQGSAAAATQTPYGGSGVWGGQRAGGWVAGRGTVCVYAYTHHCLCVCVCVMRVEGWGCISRCRSKQGGVIIIVIITTTTSKCVHERIASSHAYQQESLRSGASRKHRCEHRGGGVKRCASSTC